MIYLTVILVLMLCSALFSACETAFSSVNKIRLKSDAMQGNQRAAKALALAESFDRALTAILIGNNLVNILSASLCTILFTKWFGEGSVGFSTLAMTVLVLIFGEILPKNYAKNHAEKMALFFAAPLRALIWILTPLIFLFNQLAKLVSKKGEEPSVTEDELKVIVDQIEEEGVLEEQESDLVRSALEFDEISVDEVLVPRVRVTAIPKETPFPEITQIFLAERYSRLPVYNDTIDDIIGFITEKDFFGLLESGGTEITPIIKNVLRLPEFARISEAMKQMQRAKSHIAIVVDQYGGTKGIVTLEDIIEELVGEIYDEADEVIPMLTKCGDNSYEVSGELSIADLCDALELPESRIVTECTSVGGWLTELAGHIAEEGESVSGDWFRMTVLQMQEQRVQRILLELTEPDPDAEHENAAVEAAVSGG
ncbi:MAG: HlyC/CorC family transporter [Oscillospiraceae bacterium]|nr:HlyC/CorC family transporter [Oscillospiraceae bacterium]